MQKAWKYWLWVLVCGLLNVALNIAFVSFVLAPAYLNSGQGLAGLAALGVLVPLYLLVENPLAAIVIYALSAKLRPATLKKTFALLGTFVIVILLQLAVLFGPNYVEQIQQTIANPLPVGTKTYDFSEPIVFNSRDSVKGSLQIEDNMVIWIEHTKEAPPFRNNVWDLFLFTFDRVSSKGEITRITDLTNAIKKEPEKPLLLDGKVYFEQDEVAYVYDPTTKKKTRLAGTVPEQTDTPFSYWTSDDRDLSKAQTIFYRFAPGGEIHSITIPTVHGQQRNWAISPDYIVYTKLLDDPERGYYSTILVLQKLTPETN